MFDRESGRSRGFGFVTYVDASVSTRLLKLGDNADDNIGKVRMGDKMVEVKAAEPRPLSKRGGKGSGPPLAPEAIPQPMEQVPFYYPPPEDMAAPVAPHDQMAPTPLAYGVVPAMVPGGSYPYVMGQAVASPAGEATFQTYQAPMYYPVMMMPQPMPHYVPTSFHPHEPMPPDQPEAS